MLRRALVVLAIAFLAQSAASVARAETLIAPKQVTAPVVPYPEGATGDADVVLELTIDKEGAVESARVVEGDEPFASSARVAAMDFRFEPATRDGLPIRAIIRAKITFYPPKVEPPPVVPPPITPAPTAPLPPKPKPLDIVVEGDRKEVAQTTISGAEVKILPGAFGDPFRAIEALPGVTPLISGLPFFYVRGSPPGNTGYLIDSIKIPMLFHLGAGPSVLAPGLIDRVDFHPGGYPARYGRFTGGIVAGETTPAAKKLRGEWNVRLFDASALLEGPIGDKGDALVSGRYGYPGLLLSLLSPEVGLQYWDYQTRAGYRLTDRDRVSVFFFGAYDRLTQTKVESDGVERTRPLFDTQFHRADLRWDHQIQGGNLRLATTLMFDQSGVGEENDRGDRFAVRMLGWGARAELNKRIDDVVYLRAGADLWLESYRLIARESGSDGVAQADIFPTRADLMAGLRADLILKPSSRVELVPGVRLDFFTQGKTSVPALDPRLATRLRIARKTWLLTTLGVTHQTPSFLVPLPGLRIATLSKGLQEAYQMAEGLELELPLKSRLTVTGFYNSFRKLSDGLAVCGTETGDGGQCDDFDVRVPGRAYGLEVLLKRDLTERIGGWLAYTLSRSERDFNGRTILSSFDRTHVLSLAMSANLGAGFRFGGRFSYLTGRPATQTARVRFSTDEGFVRDLEVPIGRVRLPDFHRLDLRLEKRWTTQTRSIAVVLEWFNVYLKKEAVEWDCRVSTGTCKPEEIGPITIPSIGVEGSF